MEPNFHDKDFGLDEAKRERSQDALKVTSDEWDTD